MHLGIYGLVATVVVGVLAYDRYDKKARQWAHQRRQRAMLSGEIRAWSRHEDDDDVRPASMRSGHGPDARASEVVRL